MLARPDLHTSGSELGHWVGRSQRFFHGFLVSDERASRNHLRGVFRVRILGVAQRAAPNLMAASAASQWALATQLKLRSMHTPFCFSVPTA